MAEQIAIIRSLGGLVFDAVFEERHESTLEVTDNPVETGVTVSDHAYMAPLRATITAGVSDTPLKEIPDDKFGQGLKRSSEAFRLLQELQAKAEPFDVQTGLKLYTNMVCTRVSTQQTKDSANVLEFTAELREVIIATTQTVTYPPRKKGATAQQAGKKKEKGEQQAKPVEEAPKKQSILKQLWGLE